MLPQKISKLYSCFSSFIAQSKYYKVSALSLSSFSISVRGVLDVSFHELPNILWSWMRTLRHICWQSWMDMSDISDMSMADSLEPQCGEGVDGLGCVMHVWLCPYHDVGLYAWCLVLCQLSLRSLLENSRDNFITFMNIHDKAWNQLSLGRPGWAWQVWTLPHRSALKAWSGQARSVLCRIRICKHIFQWSSISSCFDWAFLWKVLLF